MHTVARDILYILFVLDIPNFFFFFFFELKYLPLWKKQVLGDLQSSWNIRTTPFIKEKDLISSLTHRILSYIHLSIFLHKVLTKAAEKDI